MNGTPLTVCIVIYNPSIDRLLETVGSLARSARALPLVKLFVVDNSEIAINLGCLDAVRLDLEIEIIRGHGNIGFGAGNNLVLDRIGPFHLVLNPDVTLAPSALGEAISFLKKNPQCGLVTPSAQYPDGQTQFLCKRYPTVLDLLLRGFAPEFVRRKFADRLAAYEMHDRIGAEVEWDPPLVSGCFMMFRDNVLLKIRGFDAKYFLYFEDFDISLRAAQVARIAYVPDVRIVHYGGSTSSKGARNILYFLRSARRFFWTYGFRLS